MSIDLKSVNKKIIQFRNDRDWEQYHNPKNLAQALGIEAAELQEIFLWKSTEESGNLRQDEIDRYNIRHACPKPGRCTLFVIDMQQYFLSISTPILGNVLSIIDACRSKGIRIIFTRHGHRNFLEDGGMLAEWWGDQIDYGSKDWELIKSLKPSAAGGIINKNRYSALQKAQTNEWEV